MSQICHVMPKVDCSLKQVSFQTQSMTVPDKNNTVLEARLYRSIPRVNKKGQNNTQTQTTEHRCTPGDVKVSDRVSKLHISE